MSLMAVIKTGGKQYLVKEGQTLRVEQLSDELGVSLKFEALLVSDGEGSKTQIGSPIVGGASVSARVQGHGRAEKVSVIKYKSKVRYRRNVGHRQPFTELKIEKIAA